MKNKSKVKRNFMKIKSYSLQVIVSQENMRGTQDINNTCRIKMKNSQNNWFHENSFRKRGE